jgi:exodeoxyribonuclease V alpha subunit
LSAADLNARLQQALNPQPEVSVCVNGQRLGVGDRVLQEINDDDRGVYNGETGVIESIDLRKRLLRAQLSDRIAAYTFEQAHQLTLAYAYNVHRAQGSEFPAVIVPLTTADAKLLNRSTLYTTYARAGQHLAAIGQERAFELALRAGPEETRLTGLCKRLRRQG